MFAIILDDDSQLVEGLNDERYGIIQNWDSVPKDRKIKAIFLTDGGQLTDSLSGYDFYVVCYEASARMSQSIFGEVSTSEGKVEGQVVFGVRGLGYFKSIVQQEVQKIRGSVEEAYQTTDTNNVIIARAKHRELGLLVDEVKKIFDRLEAREVSYLSLGFSRGFIPIDKFDQVKEVWREGMSDPDMVATREEIRKALLRYNDPERFSKHD